MDLTIFMGLGIGAATFLTIGIFHPITIWMEYHFTARCRWVFLILGIIGIAASLLVESLFISAILGVISFSSFWTIKEIKEQEERVAKGWFPRNPKRDAKK